MHLRHSVKLPARMSSAETSQDKRNKSPIRRRLEAPGGVQSVDPPQVNTQSLHLSRQQNTLVPIYYGHKRIGTKLFTCFENTTTPPSLSKEVYTDNTFRTK